MELLVVSYGLGEVARERERERERERRERVRAQNNEKSPGIKNANKRNGVSIFACYLWRARVARGDSVVAQASSM